MNKSDSDDNLTIDQIAESFAARLERGERPSIEEYKQKYPEYAERIEAVFPALVMLENVESKVPDRNLAVDDSIPQVLGEYEIIQEVGRGGMGIVFEAKHSTMRRRVALKVLPKSSAKKPSYLTRFLTEARSAGQLHHTNIVPVFEVGEADGLHYYAMQFIHGENLDRVIEDIIRLRKQSGNFNSGNRRGSTPGNLTSGPQMNQTDVHKTHGGLSESIAHELVVGQCSNRTAGKPDIHARTAAYSTAGDTSQTDKITDAADVVIRSSDNSSARLSDSVFGSKNSSTMIRTRSIYHQRVAAVGVQVAEALDHAHNHGVLHRDVKPANLILDTDGTVWVTDFGLAKFEMEDLTQTGDIIGTLRYMAPERFAGKADRRSDIYSLGLTLYELCTLRCAFDNDRAKLIKEVADRSIIAPRKIDESIPPDLETIVLKAIELQPERRYQTGKELAEDLQLFLADRPIKARRASLTERGWRICRRNPMLATMTACIVGLLVLLALGSLQFAIFSARKTMAEVKIRKESQRHLYLSKVDQARMRRFSRRFGQRFESLAAIQQATRLLPELNLTSRERDAARLALRNEAVAALSLTDLRNQWNRSVNGKWGQKLRIAFDANYELYAEGHDDGRIRVLRRNEQMDNAVILPSPGTPSWVIKFSPDGRFLASEHHKETALYRDVELLIWDLQNPAEPIHNQRGAVSFDFSDDGQQLLYAVGNRVEIFSLGEAKVVKTLTPRIAPRAVQFSHSADQIAVSERNGGGVEIWNVLGEPQLDWAAQVDDNITSMDWRSERSVLAVGTLRGGLHFWRGDMDSNPISLAVHQNSVNRLYIHPFQDLIATEALDSTVRLTSMVAQKEALRADHFVWLLNCGFSNDGRLCHYNKQENAVGIWEVAKPTLDVFSDSRAYGNAARFHPTQPRIVARSTNLGIEFWDIVEWKLVYLLDVEEAGKDAYFQFLHDGSGIYTSSGLGLKQWPIELTETEAGSFELKIGSPVRLIETATKRIVLTKSGDTIVVGVGFTVKAINATDGSIRTDFGRHGGLKSFALTADDQWLLTGTWFGKGVGVWDMETGELEKMLMPEQMSVSVTAHPADKNAFVTTENSISFWQLGNWDQPQVQRKVELIGATCRYVEDGSLLAVNNRSYQLLLLDPLSGKELVAVETADSERMVSYSFSNDGERLAMSCYDELQILDIAKVREELELLGLNW